MHNYLIRDEFISRGTELGNFIFDKGLFQLIGEKSCLFTTSIWQDTKKCTLLTALGLPKDMSSHRCFSIGGPRFFLRISVTMISKRFIKLGILGHYKYSRKYEVQMTFITQVYCLPIFWKEPGRTSGWNQK